MNVKLEKMEHTLMRDISDILRLEAADKILHEVTVTDVDLSGDFSVAKVYYTVLNDDNKDKIEVALKKAASFVRTEIAQRVEMRKAPEIRFLYDTSVAYGEKIEAVIKELSKKD